LLRLLTKTANKILQMNRHDLFQSVEITPEKKMGRPITVVDGQKLNLFVSKTVRLSAFKMATDEGKSISAIFSGMIMARADAKLAAESLVLASKTPPVNAIPPAV
jgi:hypothetical protein